MRQSFYPATPPKDQQPVLRTTRAFRQRLYTVVIAIFLFCSLYILLLAGLLALAAGGLYAGIVIAISPTHAYALAATIGLITVGGLSLFLFIKFAFTTNHVRRPQRIEVIKPDQPRLFEFIEQLARDTRSSVPRKIFLVPGVTTAISYSSSFWSLFFSPSKQVEIGLGLINGVSLGELKAVLAHNFSLYAARGRRLEKFAYTANRTLYHLVYENDTWDEWLDQRASRGGMLGLLAMGLHGLTNGIRGLLRGTYEGVNHHYLKIAEEIVHHADARAVCVAGHQNLITALRRTAFSTFAFDKCSRYLSQLAEQDQKTEDIYSNHRTIIAQLVDQYKLSTEYELPLLPDGTLDKYLVNSRINCQNQWAAHPARQAREHRILSIPVAVASYPQPAWKLLKNPSVLRREMTALLYETGFAGQQFQAVSSDEFKRYVAQEENYRISSAYQGFYDHRFLQRFDPDTVLATKGNSIDGLSFDMIYSEAHRQEIATFFTNREDFESLRQIRAGTIATRYFEFDHTKHRVKNVGQTIRLLSSELARQERWLTERDQQAFLWHYRQAQYAGATSEYMAYYQTLMSLQDAHRTFSENRQQIEYWRNEWHVREQWADEEMQAMTKELASIEVNFKGGLRSCDASAAIEDNLADTQRQTLIPYLRSEQTYYLKISKFDEEAFALFAQLVIDVGNATRLAYQQALKSLTDYQLGLQVAEEAHEVAEL